MRVSPLTPLVYVFLIAAVFGSLGFSATRGIDVAAHSVEAADLPVSTLEANVFQTVDQNETDPADANLDPADPTCRVSGEFPWKILRWCQQISQQAQKYKLEPDLIAAVIFLESGGDELAYSHSGAVGLMQVMPRDGIAASFTCANGPCFQSRPTIDQLQDPAYNIAYGTRLLAGLVKRHGDLREALRAYGPMDAGYSYADKILALYKRYKQ
jgi:hypothetical protein